MEAREASHRGLLPDHAVDWMRTQMDAGRWEAILRGPRRPTYEIVVAQVKGEVVAYADWSCEREGTSGGEVGELLSLFVSPPHWNLGVGGELLRYAEVRLHRLGFTDAILWVLQDNQRARRVYERGGWVADGTSANLDLGGCLVGQLRYRKALHRSAVPSSG